MSQDPLSRLRRGDRPEPAPRPEFPDLAYARSVLAPAGDFARRTLAGHAFDALLAHGVTLVERRAIEREEAAGILKAVLEAAPDAGAEESLTHPLQFVERVADRAGSRLRLGTAREELTATAARMALRDAALALAESCVVARERLIALATQHLTTLTLATANGQVVQPTSLGHYLAAQLGPLERTTARLQALFERLNQSPMGAVSGMSTAVPIDRERQAALLGFEGPIENTFDAIAADDVTLELVAVVATLAVELFRFVADLVQWGRDDVGTLAASDAYLHTSDRQPQRRDPLALNHLQARLASAASAPATLTTLLIGRQMLGGDAVRLEAHKLALQQVHTGAETLELLIDVVTGSEVNRALFAHRAHRGFSTSSELADLLAVDHELPLDEAVALTEQIVIEATAAGGEATTLRTELIDEIALRARRQEIGIEPETLAKALAPKRFIERRDQPGGPAPAAVRRSLERALFQARQDQVWLDERRARLASARQALLDAVGSIQAAARN